MYTSLHNHTEASNLKLLDCTIRPQQLIDKALEYKMNGVAITDHAIIANHVNIVELREKIAKEHPDFKIILGVELYLIAKEDYKSTRVFPHFLLLAKDEIGYKQLRYILSRAWMRAYPSKGQYRAVNFYEDFEEVIGNEKGHLFASTACLGGTLDRSILSEDVEELNNFIFWLQKTFGNDFALEMQVSRSEEQKRVNNTILKLSEFFQIPYIITTDSHYLVKEDKEVHALFLNSTKKQTRELNDFYDYTYVMSEAEIFEILESNGMTKEQIREGLDNTNIINEMCENYDIRIPTVVPRIELPSFQNSGVLNAWFGKYPYLQKFCFSKYDQDRYLFYQIEKGVIKKNIPLNDLYIERINRELEIIWELSADNIESRMSSYFNLTKDIIDTAWQISFVACGRGSSGGFLINYLVDITQIDPIKFNLWEQRFLNLSRKGAGELPDIDNDFCPEKIPFIIELLREKYGQAKVLKTLAIKTMTLKAAVIAAMRGLGLNNDESQELAAMVPSVRGKTYTLAQCINGDEEKDLVPVPQFVEALKKYDGLYEAVEKIEGLWCGRSQHASSVYVFSGEEGYLEHNCLLRSPNGTPTTAFDMQASDKLGALKEDLLSTEAQSKIQKCISLLLEDGQIEWKGSLRETYNAYLHPDVLVYDDPKMWDAMAEGKIPSLFQMDSTMGRVAMQKIHPNTVAELGLTNDTMRLTAEKDQASPIDRYVLFKNDPTAWDREMDQYGLLPEERQVLHELLDDTIGQCNQQETLMKTVMHKKVAGFDLKAANHARKVLAKKKIDQIEGVKKEFFEKGKACGTRSEFLNYIWDKCIKPQMSYSFCRIHSTQYGLVAIQEANLFCRFSPLYWVCAVLSIDAGGTSEECSEDGEELDSEALVAYETPNEQTEDGLMDRLSIGATVARKKATDYGKVARAVNNVKAQGYQVFLPDINTAKVDFVPDIKRNGIVYGLQAICNVSDKLISNILSKRPFSSMKDFLERVEVTNVQMIYLIKAGCFDELEAKPRIAIMEDYLQYVAGLKVTKKTSMTGTHIKKALEMNIFPSKFDTNIRTYLFKKWMDENQLDKNIKSYCIQDEDCIKFFNTFFVPKLEPKSYSFLPGNGFLIKQTAFNKVYNSMIEPLKNWLNSEEGLETFYQTEKEIYKNEIEQKYCTGSVSSWEMQALCYYANEHELWRLNEAKYHVVNFETLPENPVPVETKILKNGAEFPVFDISCIAGTILNADNTKHVVTLLTTYGVVDVKFFGGTYNHYNKTISILKEDGKKTVIEGSWFKRGNKILVSGIRRENMFVPKRDFSKGFKHMVQLIESVDENGNLVVKTEREQAQEE